MKGNCFLENYRIDLKRNKIHKDDQEWQVEPKVMGVLACLMAQPGEVITKEALLAEVWPDTATGQEVLTRAISALRKIFNDDPKQPRFVETIYKKGYCLLVEPRYETHQGQPVLNGLRRHRKQPYRGLWSWRQKGALAAIVIMGVLGVLLFWVKMRMPNYTALIAHISQPMPITSLEGHEYRSPISPDGHRIAFVWEGNEGHSTHNIYLKTIDEEGAVRFTNSEEDEDYPAWSPDGKYIAFARSNGAGSKLLLKPVIGGEERTLLSIDGWFFGLDWSPRGDKLVYAAKETPAQPSKIFSLSLENLLPVALTRPSTLIEGDSQPRWQRDGLGLAFVRRWNNGGETDLFWLELDEKAHPMGPPKQLTFDRKPISGISWLPGNAGMVMISSRDGYSRMWQVWPGEEAANSLPLGHGYLMAPYVDASGQRITYTQKRVEQNIWTKSLAGAASNQGERLIFSTYPDMSPIVSPDGNHLAWLSMRSGQIQLWMANPDGSQQRQISRLGGGFLASPRWMPDSDGILVTHTRSGENHIWQVPIDGGAAKQMTFAPGCDAKSFISQDRSWLYFSSNRSGSWQLWRRHLQSEIVEQVTQDGAFAAAETEDGGLIFSRFGESGLWMQAKPDQAPVKLLERLPPRSHGHWQVRDGQLFFLEWQGESYQLIQQDLLSGERVVVTDMGRLGWDGQGFSFSPDGQTLIFGQCERMESDIMMVELAVR